MSKVKGIFKGDTVQLLEPVAATNGVEVEVIFHHSGEKDQTFVDAMKQELARMEKGLSLCVVQFRQNRVYGSVIAPSKKPRHLTRRHEER